MKPVVTFYKGRTVIQIGLFQFQSDRRWASYFIQELSKI